MSSEKRRAPIWREGMLCPECGNDILIHDPRTGEVTCPSCGYVVQERDVDRGPEWRNLDEEEDRSRAGAPLSIMYRDHGLSTVIDRIDEDAAGRKLPKEVREKLLRLKKLDATSQVSASEARNLQQAVNILQIYVDKLRLSQAIAEAAMLIYRKALKAGLVRGRSIRSIMAAAVYAACRLMGAPRDLRELEKAYPIVKRKTIAQGYRLLLKHLNLKVPVADPAIFLNKIASKVGLDEATVQEALRILEEAHKRGATIGKDPVGMAAAALYMACQERNQPVTQKDIARAAGVTEVTVRNRFKGLKEILEGQPVASRSASS
ncbi:MAG: transcription initiation factor IIB [Thaumarchaeota archaeon]|nr:transcription initiation factor IIB [Nitrososphaerota archaeon]MCL7386796.1 transcription initiation factor IIB [Candidatus Wolframiiraptor allenii]MCL7394032.1 transcription initiation factor IIB [Candidatus Wolframiiraptor allenii]